MKVKDILKGGLKSSDLPSPISTNKWVAEQVKKRKNWIKNKKENEDEDILSESDFSQLEEQKYHVEENED